MNAWQSQAAISCQFEPAFLCSLLLSNHWQADEELKDAVEGLNPDAEKHESYIDIEPVSIKIPWAQSPNLRILTHFTYDLQVTGMTLGVKAGLQ